MVDGTCKCGIECPFRVEDVFNFNPVIPSIPSRFDSNKDDKIGCRQCKINNKFNQLFPPVSQDFLSDIKAAMNRNKSKNEQQAPTSGASNSNNFGSSATSRKKTKGEFYDLSTTFSLRNKVHTNHKQLVCLPF